MGKAFTDFALQTGQSALGQAMGLAVGEIQNKRQLKQQGKLQAQEIQGQKQMIDYEQMKQLEMWKNTNYGPQMEQLKKAGLNPGLIYGMSGGGGTTTGQTSGNVTGGHAQGSTGTEAITMGTAMGQMGLLRAQKDLIEAQKNKEIATTPGAGQTAAKIGAETTSILQGVENAKAQKELTEVQTQIEYVKQHIATQTQNMAIATIQTALREATERLQIMTNERTISDTTKDEKIKIIAAELAGIYAENELKKTMKGKAEAEITNIANQIKIATGQLLNAQTQTAIDQQIANFQTSFGGQAAAILQSILGILPIGKGKKTTVTHKGGAKNETIHKRQ